MLDKYKEASISLIRAQNALITALEYCNALGNESLSTTVANHLFALTDAIDHVRSLRMTEERNNR